MVANHLGPERGCLGDFAPYFTDRCRTPWGDALNFDGPERDDVRRISVLLEIPEEWAKALQRRSAWNEGRKTATRGVSFPGSNEECLPYQTLLGARPLDREQRRDVAARVEHTRRRLPIRRGGHRGATQQLSDVAGRACARAWAREGEP